MVGNWSGIAAFVREAALTVVGACVDFAIYSAIVGSVALCVVLGVGCVWLAFPITRPAGLDAALRRLRAGCRKLDELGDKYAEDDFSPEDRNGWSAGRVYPDVEDWHDEEDEPPLDDFDDYERKSA